MLGRMVLKCLAAHLDIVASLPPDIELAPTPYGLVMMCHQAVRDDPFYLRLSSSADFVTQVNRALERSLSGKIEFTKGDKTGFFSREEWGDYETKAPNKEGVQVRKVVKRASLFEATLRAWPPSRWEALFKAAEEFTTRKKKKIQAPAEELAVTESEDEIIEDSKYATPKDRRPVPNGGSPSTSASTSTITPSETGKGSGTASAPSTSQIFGIV